MRYPFLNVIRDSVINLCDNNTSLLVRGGKQERSCQFIVAHFLANILSNENLFIDCEFGRMGDAEKLVKLYFKPDDLPETDKFKRVFPDIIFHDRYNLNIFVIEIKIKNTNSNMKDSVFKDDKIKVFIYLQDILHYHYGFCVSNINEKSFKIHIIERDRVSGDPSKGQSRVLLYEKKDNQWKLKENKSETFDLYPDGI